MGMKTVTYQQLFYYPVSPIQPELFSYPANGNEEEIGRFEFYWKAGIRNLDAELAAYDAEDGEDAATDEDVDEDEEMEACTAP
ncbi:hypothetical protein CVT26_005970 [Gymnopilus dilepis]|uniref:Uncharacterized protein n=1 Tax=Gymnopilus dilepis TaxID=231916 RepID=A0A409Y1X9_9AGAR|nr:hypothetical protein CVT26_005970 [Gymnopilus dilepis]